MKKEMKKYNIGLDIGTNSVGYAVIGEDNKIIKFRGNNMWGSRIFEKGDTAQETRVKRSTRRRYNRRRERIALLQEIFSGMILEKDENFFRRLKEGFLFLEDKSIKSKHILFNDEDYTDANYYDKYKTIYHLRKDLLLSESKMDPRVTYLALHHIIKYRGHFLFEGQKFENLQGDFQSNLIILINEIREKCDIDIKLFENNIKEIAEILKKTNISRKLKQEKISDVIIENDNDKKYANELVKAILGYSFNFATLFCEDDIIDESGKVFKSSISEKKFEENESRIIEIIQEKETMLESIKKIYSWFILQEVLNGKTTLSEAMVEKYLKHAEDLKKIKKLIKKYAPEKYSEFFRKEVDEKNKYLENYKNYIKGEKRCSREKLYKKISEIFKEINNAEIKEIINDMEEDNFLCLINTKDNSAIPYQLNELELNNIIENQGKYYPELLSNKEKILSIFKFKIPYYIGPMNSESRFSWIKRSDEKIYPWNFDAIIDIDQTAENFIRRMTNKCTYLKKEDVIPKNSLLYSKYILLNELNKVRVNGKLIDILDKQNIINNLFMKNKTIKDTKFKTYLKSTNYMNTNEYEIEGYQKEEEFSASLSSYIDFTKIFGFIDFSNQNMIEEIIYWLTVFEEKDIVKRKIRNKYEENTISNKQLNEIMKLKYKGWSNLSKKLLDELYVLKDDNEKITIIKLLENTNMNFMQIINDKELGFNQKIEENNDDKSIDEITLESVRELQGSPAIKKGIWQTVKIVKEIIEILGNEPINIFIEFAREDGEKIRTSSRIKKIKNCYEKLSEDIYEYNKNVAKEIENKKYADKIDNEKLFLYFIQNGKCMYSGETLDIDKLSVYEVDHILPRAYIKDDSIENKALVKKDCNQYKSNNLLLDAKTRNQQKVFWSRLYKTGLIGVKKYNNLLREGISENEAKGFINRQLVETRQISKHLAVLFRDCYTNSTISTVKAGLTHDFRMKYGLYKCREINDYHHAHDAFLAATIGSYILRRFPGMKSELIYDEFKKYYSKGNENRNNKHGYIVSLFDKDAADDDGVVIWNGGKSIDYVKKAMIFKDCRVTKKLEEQTGTFYKETIYPAGSQEAKIQIKKGMDVNKYGGYTGQNNAYSVVVEYIKNEKKHKQIFGIPIYIEALRKQQPEIINNFLKKELGTENIKIIKEKILKYQLVEEKENLLYLTSDSEVINAKQLCFEIKSYDYYNLLSKYFTGIYSEDDEKLLEDLDEIYFYLKRKLEIHYKLFSTTTKKIYNEIKFKELEIKDKINVLAEILKLTSANSQYPNLKKYDLTDRMGRKANYNLDISETTFIDQSITGLYERRYKL